LDSILQLQIDVIALPVAINATSFIALLFKFIDHILPWLIAVVGRIGLIRLLNP
jgi:hypothetical protein